MLHFYRRFYVSTMPKVTHCTPMTEVRLLTVSVPVISVRWESVACEQFDAADTAVTMASLTWECA